MHTRALAPLLLPLALLACSGDKADSSAATADTGPAIDEDGDGFGPADDCDDSDPAVYPGAPEPDCTDPVDYNCDGSVGYADEDGDGAPACEDCDDADPLAAPGLDEVCDGIDNDCDGDTDQDALDAATFYGDADEDGYGGTAFRVEACEAPPGYVETADDCDDLDPDSHPGADEVCDEADNDCDGEIDEDTRVTWYADTDGDGYGDAAAPTGACDRPRGHVDNAGDCDDTTATTNPASFEVCDGADNDCDGSIDEAGALGGATWYADSDGDGFGTVSATVSACDMPSGYAAVATDCDDGAAAINPDAAETCDDADNDCDGAIDEADATDASTWYADSDGDGYGDASAATVACDAPAGTLADATDCDDTDADVSPAATEVCNAGTDDDCDGDADDADSSVDLTTGSTWYPDIDGDGYGDADGLTVEQCAAPSGYVADATDCDDGDASLALNCQDGLTAATAATTCGTLLADDPTAADGTYWVDPDADGDTSDAFQAWCDMTGGGWTYESQGTPFALSFTGATQTVEMAGVSAEYRFTAYGAAAGRGYNTLGVGSCGSGSLTGGFGGSATGSATFAANTTLYVEVGGQGDDGGCADQGSYNTRVGGYNGGGRGSQGGSAGGGATDLRTIDGDLSSRILVAGGGGGCGSESCIYGGGHGGGTSGGSPASHSNVTGGTQSAGGSSSYSGSAAGSLGVGGSNVQGNDEGGGGGGYYGGASGGTANVPGAGGSSYTGGMTADQSTTSGVSSGDGAVEYVFR